MYSRAEATLKSEYVTNNTKILQVFLNGVEIETRSRTITFESYSPYGASDIRYPSELTFRRSPARLFRRLECANMIDYLIFFRIRKQNKKKDEAES